MIILNINTLLLIISKWDLRNFRNINSKYKPGYIYRKLKTCIYVIPLEPIISQTSTPTTQNIKPSLSPKYGVNSSNDFIQFLKKAINKIMAWFSFPRALYVRAEEST